MSKKSGLTASFANIIGVITLILGVFGGVYLVQKEQDITNKASEIKEHKVVVCHRTGSDSNPWVQIEVSENALNPHLEHGDIQGNCPSQKKDDEGKDDKKDDKGGGGQGGVNLGTNVTVVNQVVAEAPEPLPEVRYVYITTRLDFWVKFQGIDSKKKNKSVRVIFRNEDELHVYNKVIVTSDAKGVYKGVITDIRPGTYEVLVKGDGYLQRMFEIIIIKRGVNIYYWNDRELLAGDFNSDNILELKDLAELLSVYNEEINPVQTGFEVFDLDLDGYIEIKDIELVLINFNQLKLVGEE